MSLTDAILLVIAAPFLYFIGYVAVLALILLCIGGLIAFLSWLEKRNKR